MNIVVSSVLILLGLLASWIVYQCALFTPVNIRRQSFPELNVAYTTFVGPYKDAYAKVKGVETFLEEKYGSVFSEEPCFGIYYDNPQEVEASKCRSVVGKILPANIIPGKNDGTVSFGKIEAMKDTLSVDYPLRSFLSIMSGMIRVYPKLNEYFQTLPKGTQRGASFELYGFHGKNTTFMMPISDLKGLAVEFPNSK